MISHSIKTAAARRNLEGFCRLLASQTSIGRMPQAGPKNYGKWDFRFCRRGGGGSRKPPKIGWGGSLEKGSHGSTIKKILSTMVYVKRVMHACPPYVARIIQHVVLTEVYALSRYAVTLVT